MVKAFLKLNPTIVTKMDSFGKEDYFGQNLRVSKSSGGHFLYPYTMAFCKETHSSLRVR